MATKTVDSAQDATDGTADADIPDQASTSASAAESDLDMENHADTARGRSRRTWSTERLALCASTLMVVALAALTGWLGFRANQLDRATAEQAGFVEAARQAAVNLTTIDFEHADTDVQRILESATGTFHDDFQARSAPFIEVVKKAQSRSEGTVTMSGLESVDGDNAAVLVAMSVKTTTTADPQSDPRAWRMRIDVQKAGKDMKISNVEFVP